MSRPAEPSWSDGLDRERLAERGYKRCEHCRKLLPLNVSRCRRRRCPGYGATWARDTMRKIRENLRAYGGLAAMCTLTAPGEAMGLVWDRSKCAHPAEERCDGRKGCRVVKGAAEAWNRHSRAWWRDLNRVCKQRADRALRRLGHERKGWSPSLRVGASAPRRLASPLRSRSRDASRTGVGNRVRRSDAGACAHERVRLRRCEAAPTSEAGGAGRAVPEQVPRQVEAGRKHGDHGDRHRGRPHVAQLR